MRVVVRALLLRTWVCLLLLNGCGGAENDPECASDSECPAGFTCRAGGCYELIGERCADDDGDGASAGPGCDAGDPIDCDDTDATRYPGASEICGDGINQDCNAGADVGCECVTDVGVGGTRDCGQGACAGTQTCAMGGWGECRNGETVPTPEICGADGMGDDIDQDCNGVPDDGCVTCSSRPDGMGTEVVCFDDAGQPAFCSSNSICI